jgi:hypothetical protein
MINNQVINYDLKLELFGTNNPLRAACNLALLEDLPLAIESLSDSTAIFNNDKIYDLFITSGTMTSVSPGRKTRVNTGSIKLLA